MKYVRYESRGNTVGIEDGVDDYWEMDDDGYVVRSINMQPDGSRLKYDREHDADSLGALPEGAVSDEMLSDKTFGTITFLSTEEFDAQWRIRGRNQA